MIHLQHFRVNLTTQNSAAFLENNTKIDLRASGTNTDVGFGVVVDFESASWVSDSDVNAVVADRLVVDEVDHGSLNGFVSSRDGSKLFVQYAEPGLDGKGLHDRSCRIYAADEWLGWIGMDWNALAVRGIWMCCVWEAETEPNGRSAINNFWSAGQRLSLLCDATISLWV